MEGEGGTNREPLLLLPSIFPSIRVFSNESALHIRCVQLCATLWTVACQAPLFMGFSRQEYWSGLLCQCSGHKRCWFNLLWDHCSFLLGFDPWVGKIPWRRKWQPTSIFLPGKSHGQRSLADYSPWGCKESDTNYQLLGNAALGALFA